MPQRQLNIRSDDAAERAARLAQQFGKTTTEVVVEALRCYEAKMAPLDERGWTRERRQRFDRLMALSAEARKHLIADAPADHDWLYDENGLPK
jgi:hypothetical protein